MQLSWDVEWAAMGRRLCSYRGLAGTWKCAAIANWLGRGSVQLSRIAWDIECAVNAN